MKYRTLGRTGFTIGEIGYGAWGIGGKQWQGGTDDESLAALRRAVELGLNFIDTALAYGDGHSEQLVGQIVRDAPGKIYVASKVPPKNQLWPARLGIPIQDAFPYDYILRSTEKSLRNLRMETLDLQQLHVWNPEWIASDEWRRGLEELKRSGKAQAVGISINDHQPDSALEAIRTGLIDSVQVIYNIFDQSPERRLFPLAQELNIGVIARVPFDEGSLTGTVTESSTFESDEFRSFYFRGDRRRQVAQRVDALKKDVALVDGSLPETALRFCLSHPAVSTVVPGMRRVRNVERNCAASAKGALDAETLRKLRGHVWEKNFYS
ncbi:MAG: aldo/keto reductase [Bryobacteraceae bacterium]